MARNGFALLVLILSLAICGAAAETKRAALQRLRKSSAQLNRTITTITPPLVPVEARVGRKLDIVIAHYHTDTLHVMLTNWTRFLNTPKVKQMAPTVFIYCTNEYIDLGVYEPLLGEAGHVEHVANVGREGAVYLAHIIAYRDNLAEHTLFSQAVADPVLEPRFEHLFSSRTGIMALAVYAHQNCGLDDGWLPLGQLSQLFSIFTRKFCSPEGYSAMFNGQFIVAKQRILAHPKEVYEHVNDLLTAPIYHWIHTVHSNPHYKHMSNPFFGHSLERAWSLAFNCYDLWRYEVCGACDRAEYLSCHPEACQCLD